MVFNGRRDEQFLKLLLFTLFVAVLVLISATYLVDDYAEYRCGPEEHLGLDFTCHADFDAVQLPATATTTCGEDEVLTGEGRCVELNDPPG